MQGKIKLSNRLKTIASFVSEGAYFADIGSDHGYLSSYICMRDDQAKAIASEVREGPYLRTKESVAIHQLIDRIEVRFGDGLSVLNEHDTITEIVIAGMGGSLITDILLAGIEHVIKVNKIIVQPNNKAERLRLFFEEHGFTLTNEVILAENNQIYEILVAEKSGRTTPYKADILLEKQLLFGPMLMQEKSTVFKQKWHDEKNKLIKILEQIEHNQQVKVDNEDKVIHLKRHLKWIEEVLQ